ncbi:MAG: BlaI/MecI/CopY family transcriptional regulator [Planctomycetaceae bacterium]|nr:BlaI/MecI/CopY family transcriptional regulator [Planctomycetaceae bacterium]
MASEKRNVKISEGEMELLQLLWRLGPSLLSVVHQNYGRPIGYTTIQTRLNRMVDKGVVTKSDDYPALYSATAKAEDASARYFDLIRHLCGDNIAPLVSHLAKGRRLRPDEIAMLKQFISEHENGGPNHE